jgi:hypothetical protein
MTTVIITALLPGRAQLMWHTQGVSGFRGVSATAAMCSEQPGQVLAVWVIIVLPVVNGINHG